MNSNFITVRAHFISDGDGVGFCYFDAPQSGKIRRLTVTTASGPSVFFVYADDLANPSDAMASEVHAVAGASISAGYQVEYGNRPYALISTQGEQTKMCGLFIGDPNAVGEVVLGIEVSN
jgi:hypothetical protein